MSNLNLMVHAGGYKVEREQLNLVEMPPMNQVTGWTPIHHGDLVDEVTNTLQASGYTINSEAHALARDGLQYFGMIEVVYEGELMNDYSMVIGLRNSHNKTFPAGLVCGTGVFVCDNLAFSGEIKIGRKHTRHIQRDLPGLVHTAVGKLGDMRQAQDTRIQAYKQFELTDNHADHLILQMLRDGIISTLQVPRVVDEWDSPRHPEFASEGRTAWRLFNATTEALKGSLARLPRSTMALHGLMDSTCRIYENAA